jgi:hypothetical protein
MQTQQRKIPIRGANGTFKTWTEVLVPFDNELTHFEMKIDSLKRNAVKQIQVNKPLLNADVSVFDSFMQHYLVDSAATVFSDSNFVIQKFAKELKGLRGLKLNYNRQMRVGTEINFKNARPIKILVGYFKPKQDVFSKDTTFLKSPELETNASANDYGQAEIKIANAIVIKGMPPVNIHSYTFAAGTNTLKLAKGICLIVGFVDGEQVIPLYDAGLTEGGIKKEIDWLFE